MSFLSGRFVPGTFLLLCQSVVFYPLSFCTSSFQMAQVLGCMMCIAVTVTRAMADSDLLYLHYYVPIFQIPRNFIIEIVDSAAQKVKFRSGHSSYFHALAVHMLFFLTLFFGGRHLRLLKKLNSADGL